MKKASGTLIPIELVVARTIPLFESKDLASALCQKLKTSVIEYLSLQGIEGLPEVGVQPARGNGRVMQVFIHGVRQPYSPKTMRRAWQSRAPRHLQELPDRGTISYQFPDRWLNEYLLGLDQTDQKAVDYVLSFLSDLAFAAIMERPSSLVTKPQVLQYVHRLDESYQLDVDFTARVLTFLLDQGVSVADARTILESIRRDYRLGRSSEDTSELLFAKLRRPCMELIVSPEEFRTLTGGEQIHGSISVYSDEVSKESRDLMNTMEEGLFWEMGLYLPDLVWKIDPEMPPGLIAFRTNDQTTQCIPLLAQDRLLVDDTPDRLKLLNITDAAMTANPASGKPCSVIPVVHKALIENSGFTIWEPLGYLVLLTTGEIKRRAAQLFTVDDAVYHLTQIRDVFPVLVEKVLKRFSIEDLTRVFRAILAERSSIRDLRSILERLLQYETITVDASKFIVFDERLAISPGSNMLHPASPQSYYEFVRSGLKRQSTYSLLRGQSTITVYLLDPPLEKWLVTENVTERGNMQEIDNKRHAIREAIWSEIGDSNTLDPIILTTVEPRVALWDIISLEMPHVRVISYPELSPDVSIRPVARVRLPVFGRERYE